MPAFISRQLVGHTSVRTRLHDLIQKKRLPQSLIFTGPEGIGKSMTANAVAESVLCEGNRHPALGGCGECASCKLLLVENHPDLFKLNCDEEGAEEARHFISSMTLTSFRGQAKIALITEAHKITPQAANALLKTLEEPRPNSFYVLVTNDLTRTLPTIRSRCQVISFDRLSATEVHQVVSQLGFSFAPDSLENILCSESLAYVTEMDKLKPILNGAADALHKILKGDTDSALALAQSLSQKKEAIKTACSFLRLKARELLHRSVRSSEHSPKQASALATFLENLVAAERAIFERNLSAQLVLSFILTTLAQGKQSLLREVML